jgi:hypothetical protein
MGINYCELISILVATQLHLMSHSIRKVVWAMPITENQIMVASYANNVI